MALCKWLVCCVPLHIWATILCELCIILGSNLYAFWFDDCCKSDVSVYHAACKPPSQQTLVTPVAQSGFLQIRNPKVLGSNAVVIIWIFRGL